MMRVMWLLLTVAACPGCGDDGNNRKILDAPAVRDDAPEGIDAAATAVTVTVTPNIANVEVYFQNADSTLVATKMTDATGTASQVMVAGGYVTLVDPDPNIGKVVAGGPTTSHDLYTYSGVKPGDHLIYATNQPTSLTSTTHTFTFPIDSQHAAASYEVFTTCNGETINFQAPSGTGVSTVVQESTLDGCGATTDFMVVGRDIDNQNVSWFYKPAVALTDGDSHDFSVATTYAATTDRTFEFDNNPSADSEIDLTDSFIRSSLIFGASTNGAGATTDLAISEPMFPAMTLDVIQTTQQAGSTNRNMIYWGPTAGAYMIDYGGLLIGDFTSEPSLDTGTHAISWTLGTGKPADFSAGSVNASRDGSAFWFWTIVGPNATTLQLPTLPTDVQDFTVASTDTFGVQGIGDGIVPGGYDAFRPTAFNGPPSVVGATGTTTFNTYQPQMTFAADKHLPSSFLDIKRRLAKASIAHPKRPAWPKR